MVQKCALISPLCVPHFSLIGVCNRKLWQKMQSVRNEEEKTKKLFQNFVHLYLGISWYDLHQIWYVDSPSSGASQQQIWLNSGKRSRSYIGVKITFFVFLSIYSRCGATASWAAQHTTVCLEFFFVFVVGLAPIFL